jgi:hypothetical protein
MKRMMLGTVTDGPHKCIHEFRATCSEYPKCVDITETFADARKQGAQEAWDRATEIVYNVTDKERILGERIIKLFPCGATEPRCTCGIDIDDDWHSPRCPCYKPPERKPLKKLQYRDHEWQLWDKVDEIIDDNAALWAEVEKLRGGGK